MLPEQIGTTIGLVIGITFIFDVIELQPRVGFGFLCSLSFLFYHIFSGPELETHLRQMLLQARRNADAINTHVQDLKNIAQNNPQFLEAIMAFQVADMSLEYARSLVAERQRSIAGPQATP